MVSLSDDLANKEKGMTFGESMKITDFSFTNDAAEYKLIKELSLEVETCPDMDNRWDPGGMDWWRYNLGTALAKECFKRLANRSPPDAAYQRDRRHS